MFPLTGNQKEAEICVVLNNPPVYANVTVGAKAASACADESTRGRCKVKNDHPGDGCPMMPPPWTAEDAEGFIILAPLIERPAAL